MCERISAEEDFLPVNVAIAIKVGDENGIEFIGGRGGPVGGFGCTDIRDAIGDGETALIYCESGLGGCIDRKRVREGKNGLSDAAVVAEGREKRVANDETRRVFGERVLPVQAR